jgi:hypothetical protein
MKKFIIAVLVFSLVACSKTNDAKQNEEVSFSVQSVNAVQYEYLYFNPSTGDMFAVRFNTETEVIDTVGVQGNSFNHIIREIDARLPDSTHTWITYHTTYGMTITQKNENVVNPE